MVISSITWKVPEHDGQIMVKFIAFSNIICLFPLGKYANIYKKKKLSFPPFQTEMRTRRLRQKEIAKQFSAD
ncbi:MAG: hypothetical protein NT096_00645 [Proteobacteria bacterium]|nr:hypothetical protein [Pseudomonadota bacterium]